MILQEYLLIKISSKQVEYYNNLGYKVTCKQSALIKNSDVLDGSRVIEKRKCDLCGCVYEKPHVGHIRTYNRYHKDICPNCVKNDEEIKIITKTRRASTLLKHYGVDNPSKSDLIKQKKIDTVLSHYGVENPMQSDEIKLKA